MQPFNTPRKIAFIMGGEPENPLQEQQVFVSTISQPEQDLEFSTTDVID